MADNVINADTQKLRAFDVYDVLTPYDMFTTPIASQIAKGDNPEDTLFRWPGDVPDDPDNEGTPDSQEWDASDTLDFGNRGFLLGRVHHREVNYGVGGVAQGNSPYGTDRKKEFQVKAIKALRFLNKCKERILVGGQEAAQISDSVEGITRGLDLWITDTADIANQTDTDTRCPAQFRPDEAQIVQLNAGLGDYDLNEKDHLQPAFQSIYSVLGAPITLDVFCTPLFKGKVSDWGNYLKTESANTVVKRYNADVDDKSFQSIIDFWRGDTGEARFHLHPFLRKAADQTAEALGIDFRFIRTRERSMPQTNKDLAKRGTLWPGQAFMTFGLQCTPKYLAKWWWDAAVS